MKNVKMNWLAVAIVLLLTVGANESAVAREPVKPSVESRQVKEKIKKEDLPAEARKQLDGDAFKGWTVVQAYRIKAKNEQGEEAVEYEVEVKKENETKTVKFDKDGKSKQ